MKQHKQRLTTWLKDQNILPGETIDSITISRLVEGTSRQVTSWNAYDINGYTYYTHTKDSCLHRNLEEELQGLEAPKIMLSRNQLRVDRNQLILMQNLESAFSRYSEWITTKTMIRRQDETCRTLKKRERLESKLS